MRVLVTGAAGFIGSHLCDALVARGDEVIGLDNFDPHYPRPYKQSNLDQMRGGPGAFQLLEADVRALPDLSLPVRPDAVIHLAALADMRPSLEDPISYLDINVRGTLAALEFCRRGGIRNLVYASSSLVYGDRDDVPFKESDPADAPVSLYAAAKRSGELLCHAWSRLHGLNVTCLRFFTVYGPRQRPEMAIHKFARLIHAGREIPLYGFGRLERDYVHVTDLVAGTVAALDSVRGFHTYNLGSAQPTGLDVIIRHLEEGLGRKATVRLVPGQPGDVKVTFACIDQARADLGWEPRMPLEAGLRGFVEWYLSTAVKIELAIAREMSE